MSLRDAIDLANTTAGVQEIWLPAWEFILTLERTADDNEIELDISQGDLEVTESLVIRGIADLTRVAWPADAMPDKVFELIGDYDDDGYSNRNVDQSDYAVWAAGLLAADGDDDGDVDDDDYDIWVEHFGNSLTLDGVMVS
jgi:hypothetical protein